jgi:hypothetical protein
MTIDELRMRSARASASEHVSTLQRVRERGFLRSGRRPVDSRSSTVDREESHTRMEEWDTVSVDLLLRMFTK